MATFTFYQDFKEQLGKGVHDLSSDTVKVALTNSAPNAATHTILSDVTQIANGNGYTTGGSALASSTYTETGGTGTFIASDLVFTASGGTMGTFRYAVFYNDTATSPLDALIGYVDYGSAVSLASGDTFTLDFTTSIFTIA